MSDFIEVVEVEDADDVGALTTTQDATGVNLALGAAVAASTGLSAYHGYRRGGSVGSALLWGLAGAFFPVVTPAIALAQGFGKRAGKARR